MDKMNVRHQAYRRMSRIEELFQDRDIPTEVMALYRLMKLIYSASFENYFREFGFLPVDLGDVNEAKQVFFNWGPVTAFERETCELLNSYCEQRERQAVKPPVVAYTERVVGVFR